MAPVNEKLAICIDAEQVQNINREEPSPKKATIPKDGLINSRSVKLPKNLILVEGDPMDDAGVLKRREMRSFPSEELLSAKIKMANGTDYSNHFIEQHFSRSSSNKRKCKKKPKNVGLLGLLKKEEISLVDSETEVEKKRRNSNPGKGIVQDIIDLTKSTEEEEIIGHKNVEDHTRHKFDSKLSSSTVCLRLVPYSSSSNDESDEEKNVTMKSRWYFIRKGLNEGKFKFQNKTMADGH